MTGNLDEEKRMLREVLETAKGLCVYGVLSTRELDALRALCSVPLKDFDQAGPGDGPSLPDLALDMKAAAAAGLERVAKLSSAAQDETADKFLARLLAATGNRY